MAKAILAMQYVLILLDIKTGYGIKIKLLLINTYYFSVDDLRILEQNLLYSSVSIQYEK